ncbi:MAG: CRISPR-associated protein Cas4 [Lentisphaeraceae bacterium]|nr:CRISPR-associated protein Cas4 [Lentisphaeraceae bacterium]
MHITGKEIEYLYVCKRKLWLYRHGLRLELEFQNVQIGMHIQEATFKREEKDIPIGEIGVIDWAAFKHGVIHETKKGKTPGKGDVAQVRYYMWWLNNNGIRVDECKIHYPKMRQTKSVMWDDEANKAAEKDLAETRQILDQDKPPSIHKYPYCKSCAYQELCYA